MARVLITDHARAALASLPGEKPYQSVRHSILLLGDAPFIGRVYDPLYDAARPSFACRELAVPGTRYTIYYHLDEEGETVTVFDVIPQRRDPRARFSE